MCSVLTSLCWQNYSLTAREGLLLVAECGCIPQGCGKGCGEKTERLALNPLVVLLHVQFYQPITDKLLSSLCSPSDQICEVIKVIILMNEN